MTPQEAAIFAAFKEQSPLHNKVKIALLQVLHAGRWAELDLPLVAEWIQRTIEDPPWSIWFGPDEPLQLAVNLENIAAQLRRASFAMNAAKPHWQKFEPSEGAPNVVGIREDRARLSTKDAGST